MSIQFRIYMPCSLPACSFTEKETVEWFASKPVVVMSLLLLKVVLPSYFHKFICFLMTQLIDLVALNCS